MKWYIYEVENHLGFINVTAVYAGGPVQARKLIQEKSEYEPRSMELVEIGEDKSDIIADEFIYRDRILKTKPKKYEYNGSVLSYGKLVQQNWKATTQAPTYGKAKNNLIYRYKKEAGLPMGSGITLPGELREIV